MSSDLEQSSSTLSRTQKSWLLAFVVLVGAVALTLGASVIVAMGQGADFGSVFNEPARTADGEVEITWSNGEPLLRSLEPQTVEGIESAWTRAQSSIENAAFTGDMTGIDIWFSGSAKDQVYGLVATESVTTSVGWESDEITPDFYSIDGQVLVTTIERTAVTATDEAGAVDELRAVFILRDGNWRIEHLVRVGTASSR